CGRFVNFVDILDHDVMLFGALSDRGKSLLHKSVDLLVVAADGVLDAPSECGLDRLRRQRRRNGKDRYLGAERACEREPMLNTLVRKLGAIGRNQDVLVHRGPPSESRPQEIWARS